MKNLFFAFILFFSSSNIISQESQVTFPDNALGIYKGLLKIDSKNGAMNVNMEFHLTKTDAANVYQYKLIYGNQPRYYNLIVKDQEKGIYEIDENNGIILPAKFHDHVLYSFFEVQGNLLTTRMQFKKDQMFFEILFTRTSDKVTSGGVSEKIPKVFGYPITTIQKATLFKQ